MKVKNYYKIYYKMVGVKIGSSNTQIHDHSLSWLGTGTSIKKYGDKHVYWPKDINHTGTNFHTFCINNWLAYKPKTSVGFDQLFTDNKGNFI